MKSIATLVLLLSLIRAIPAVASGSYYVESQNYATKNIFSPGLTSILNQNFSENAGGFLVMVLSPSYAEFYAGPTFTPASNIQFGVGIGLEEGPSRWRTGNYIFLSHESYSALLSTEYGPGGFFYLADLEKQINSNLSLGIFAQRNTGIGPKASYSISNTPLTIWLVPSFDPESNLFGAVASLRATFNQ